jgi:hypothetical protein
MHDLGQYARTGLFILGVAALVAAVDITLWEQQKLGKGVTISKLCWQLQVGFAGTFLVAAFLMGGLHGHLFAARYVHEPIAWWPLARFTAGSFLAFAAGVWVFHAWLNQAP